MNELTLGERLRPWFKALLLIAILITFEIILDGKGCDAVPR